MDFSHGEFATRKEPSTTEVPVGAVGLAACSCCRPSAAGRSPRPRAKVGTPSSQTLKGTSPSFDDSGRSCKGAGFSPSLSLRAWILESVSLSSNPASSLN